MTDVIREMARLLDSHKPVLALTGAGISTASGIPAYRDKRGKWVMPQPVNAADFKAHESVRKRYWRRSMHGWPRFHQAKPNGAHNAITTLQQHEVISTVITQNVDGLHQSAGTRRVIDLHGSLSQVSCLLCGDQLSRAALQLKLVRANSQFLDETITIGPDGDATPVGSSVPDNDFDLVPCEHCGGALKPDVVFYGENVPEARVQSCVNALANAQALLCIGSSLSVLSGFRFCRMAVAQNKPVLIINQGQTRADDIATICADEDCTDALKQLQRILID